jgi:O-antigen ligase
LELVLERIRNSILKDKRTHVLLLLVSLLAITVVYLFSARLSDTWFYAITIALPLVLLSMLNEKWVQFFAIASANIRLIAFGTHIAIFFPVLVLISHSISTGKIALFQKANPIRKYFVLYFLAVLPSLANSPSLLKSLFMMCNLVSIFILVEMMVVQLLEKKDVMRVVKTFVFWTTANSFSVFYQILHTSERVYGFTGLVFVDFSCVTIIIIVSKLFFSKSSHKMQLLTILSINFIALIFTQTRNTLISLMLCIFVTFLYCFISRIATEVSRIELIKRAVLGMAIVGLLAGFIFMVKPEAFQRHKSLVSNQKNVSQVSGVEAFTSNSTGTRILIWTTALNGFIKHPIIGIGAYSFSFNSEEYNILPAFLYKTYVDGLSPHITYLAVLCETGIVGAIGFCLLIVMSLRMSLRSLSISVSEKEKSISLGILSVNIYITCSMFFSDAWLWHQCGFLWGLVLGVSMANYNRLAAQFAGTKFNFST